MNVLITRPLHQAQSLKSLLENDGHNGLLFPTLKIKKLIVDVEINNYDALIFISKNSV
ncbi:MAG TPA: uroporphyrinogen-III synthase, partial [Gammaproteobacteria bacterium]|nr:uroporphyrinogen-III synthase [Gammaproteobacteria bacterium]